MKHAWLTILLFLFTLCTSAEVSPNGKIHAEYRAGEGLVVSYETPSGLLRIMTLKQHLDNHGVANNPAIVMTRSEEVEYDMLLGKKSHCTNAYNEYSYTSGLIVRLYDDGIAWTGIHSYNVSFTDARNNWIAEWRDSYEEFFPKNRTLKDGQRYAYPALFEYDGGIFSLLSESCMTAANAATSMYYLADSQTFDLRPEGNEDGGWQTMIVGQLADIVESTLITDNSQPCALLSTLSPLTSKLSSPPPSQHSSLTSQHSSLSSWIRPGVAAWVYWAYNHGSNDYNIIKRYTDMAVTMKLPYVLIDAEWDNFLPPYTVEDAVRYAVDNGVSPIIWYSSSIGWVDGAPGPKFRLNKPEDREREFAWCERIGIKGVKIDFFSGDSNQNIRFMIELLESAARHHLLVNFHGATIPRGWQRTYPNLVSTEGVYGEEWYNNKLVFTDKAACHNATLPFTRNVVGSMDYTPCAFTDSQHPHITTHAHELALTALFESGIQHLADRPESFLAQPQAVRDYLTNLPTAWDDTRLLAGYPGDYVILARRKGSAWYIAGINGNDTVRSVSIPTERLDAVGHGIRMFTDSGDVNNPWCIDTLNAIPATVTLRPRGGFVIVAE